MSQDNVDILIVGGGAAGCVLGRRLADRGRTVLLLEAGPDLGTSVSPAMLDGWRNPQGSDWTTDWGYETEPGVGEATTNLRRGKLLGGTSWLTRFAVRGHPADFDDFAANGNPGWSFAEVLPSFRLLEADAELLLVGLGPGLDGERDDRLGEVHRLEHDRLLLVAQRVASGDALEPHGGGNIAGVNFLDVFPLIGVHLQ